jgi:DNA polymerase III subunit delta'
MIDLPDQPLAERILRAALARDDPPQQLLLHGPPGSGKRAAARSVAWALIDPEREHPLDHASLDLTVLAPAGHLIRLEDLDPALADLAARPAVGRRRVLVIEGAERLIETASAPRILKRLEEPPPRSHLILVTDRAVELIPTIRSRCLPVPFRSPGWRAIAARLVEGGVSETEAEALARADGPQALAAAPFERRCRALGVELALAALVGERPGAEVVRGIQLEMERQALLQPSRELQGLREEAAARAGKRGERTALKRVEDQEKRELRRALSDGWAHVLDGAAGLVADALAVAVGAESTVRHRDRLEALRAFAVPQRQAYIERAGEEIALARSELILNPTLDLAAEALLTRIARARREGEAGPLVSVGRIPW